MLPCLLDRVDSRAWAIKDTDNADHTDCCGELNTEATGSLAEPGWEERVGLWINTPCSISEGVLIRSPTLSSPRHRRGRSPIQQLD